VVCSPLWKAPSLSALLKFPPVFGLKIAPIYRKHTVAIFGDALPFSLALRLRRVVPAAKALEILFQPLDGRWKQEMLDRPTTEATCSA
jgi:hypothetical protein